MMGVVKFLGVFAACAFIGWAGNALGLSPWLYLPLCAAIGFALGPDPKDFRS